MVVAIVSFYYIYIFCYYIIIVFFHFLLIPIQDIFKFPLHHIISRMIRHISNFLYFDHFSKNINYLIMQRKLNFQINYYFYFIRKKIFPLFFTIYIHSLLGQNIVIIYMMYDSFFNVNRFIYFYPFKFNYLVFLYYEGLQLIFFNNLISILWKHSSFLRFF